MRSSRLIPLAMAALLASPAFAQEKTVKEAPTAGTDAGTTTLNRESAAAAREQNAANAAGQQQYTQAVHDYEAQRSRTAAARAQYEQEMEANRQARAAYDAAYARWQADVAACNNGDRTRCAPPPPR